jgi:hypothetical protein
VPFLANNLGHINEELNWRDDNIQGNKMMVWQQMTPVALAGAVHVGKTPNHSIYGRYYYQIIPFIIY